MKLKTDTEELKRQIFYGEDDQIKEKAFHSFEKATEETILFRIERNFRIIFSIFIMLMFLGLNLFIVYLIYKAFSIDLDIIKSNPSYDRLVDQKVLMTLIGSILAETAIAFGLLAKFLYFKKPETIESE